MKSTKYLFDEQRSPEGMISVSQLQSFLSCKKKWEYGYMEEITPRVDRPYLTIGKLCHKGMQTVMQYKWEHEREIGYTREKALAMGLIAMENEHREYLLNNMFLQEEIPEIEGILTDAEKVFKQAFWEFNIDRYEVVTLKKDGKLIPALELHFVIPCPPTKGLHGYIDAILLDRVTGFVWCTDYKFRKSLSPNEDEENNIQNAVYTYACNKMQVKITGTMTWQHLNTPAVEPTILKNGSVSRSKVKTTWSLFENFCYRNGINPEEYREEMQEKLKDIEWYRATYEYRNEETVERIWKQCVVPGAKAIKAASKANAVNFRSLYPWNCKMCQYRDLCQAELRGYDSAYIRSNNYVKRSHVRVDNKPIDAVFDTVV